MQNTRDEQTVVLPKMFQILVLILFAVSAFLFFLLLVILSMNSVFDSINPLLATASGLSLLTTWPLYRLMRKAHSKNAFIQFDLFMFIGAFIFGILGTFISGYLIMLFWPNQLGPLPAIMLSTLPYIVMGMLVGNICWHQIFEYGEHHASTLYTYVSVGAILTGAIGFFATGDYLFTTPCGIILGIYVGWRLWRWRYYKRAN